MSFRRFPFLNAVIEIRCQKLSPHEQCRGRECGVVKKVGLVKSASCGFELEFCGHGHNIEPL